MRRQIVSGLALGLVLLVLVGLATLVLAGRDESTSPEPAALDELIGTAPWALQLLTQLDISDGAAPVPYDRDDYDGWQDVDGDCQSARHEVLIAESTTDVDFIDTTECRVARGSWIDPYTNTAITDVTNASIDHVVSLSESHHAGAWAWSSERKRALFNDIDDPATLVVSATDMNSAKGARGPDEWLPGDADARCLYLVARVRVKARWQLTVSTSEHEALLAGLSACADQELPAEPETTPLVIVDFSQAVPTPKPAPPPVVTPGTCDPRYTSTCIAISAGDLDCEDIAPRDFDATGSDPHNFDGDNNGIGCEVPS